MSNNESPHIGVPLSLDQISEYTTTTDFLEDMSFALHDWVAAANWLTKLGAPDLNEHGNTMNMKDRFLWVVSHLSLDDLDELAG